MIARQFFQRKSAKSAGNIQYPPADFADFSWIYSICSLNFAKKKLPKRVVYRMQKKCILTFSKLVG